MQIHASKSLVIVSALLLGAVGCELTTEPKSTVSEANIFTDPDSYRSFLAKIYAGLAVTGQQGPAGQADIQGIDEGFSHYMRQYWQMQELPTEEAVIAWNDVGLPELSTQLWASANTFVEAMYARVFFQVSQANEFLRQTTAEKLEERDQTDLKPTIDGFRAEARFLRALSYWHGIDLFGDIPLVDEDFPIGATPPEQSTADQIFSFIVSELNDIKTQLSASPQYGRAGQDAAAMLLAKLYMNADAYTGAAQYADALQEVQSVINSGAYALDDVWQEIFLADNHTSPEIVWAIPSDGLKTRTWGGMTFLTHAAVGGNMNAADFGLDGGWWGLRVTPQLIALFEGGVGGPDKRVAPAFTEGHSLSVNILTDFFSGYPMPKYRNVTSGGTPGSHATFPDTDFPMFRLTDAYLMYAELVLRGAGGDRSQALDFVNQIRMRAYGNASGNITDAQLTLDFILDERARELYWEGHRRTDLIRYGMFTENGIWDWKGGIQPGRETEAFRDRYPIPATELLSNPNLQQNPGY